MKRVLPSFGALLLLSGCTLFEGSSGQPVQEREKQTSALEHDVSNMSSEIAVLQRRIAYLESQLTEVQQTKASGQENISARLAKVEGDVTAMKKRTTEIASSVKDIEDATSKRERSSQDSLKNLDTAVRTLGEAMQKNISSKEAASGKTYKVKAGDTLGKIAYDNDTTVQALLTLNGLKSGNHIVAGQEIQIPE